MGAYRLINTSYTARPEEVAAYYLAEAQHAPGVTCYMGSDFQVHYKRPDGTHVPGYEYFLEKAMKGEL